MLIPKAEYVTKNMHKNKLLDDFTSIENQTLSKKNHYSNKLNKSA